MQQGQESGGSWLGRHVAKSGCYSIGELVRLYTDGNLKLATFQRSNKWEIKNMQDFLLAIMEGLPSGQIVTHRREETSQIRYIVDGAHRCRSIVGYAKNRFALYVDGEWIWYNEVPAMHVKGIRVESGNRSHQKRSTAEDEVKHRVMNPKELCYFQELNIPNVVYGIMDEAKAVGIFTRCQFSICCSREDKLRALRNLQDENYLVNQIDQRELEIKGWFKCMDPSKMKISTVEADPDLLDFTKTSPNILQYICALFLSWAEAESAEGDDYKAGRAYAESDALVQGVLHCSECCDRDKVDAFFYLLHDTCMILNRENITHLRYSCFVVYMHCHNYFGDFSRLFREKVSMPAYRDRPWEKEQWQQGKSDNYAHVISARIGRLRDLPRNSRLRHEWVPGTYSPVQRKRPRNESVRPVPPAQEIPELR